MLWNNYVFSYGDQVHDLWDDMYSKSNSNSSLLYITGRGFDSRGCTVLSSFLDNIKACGCKLVKAELLLVDFSGYKLGEELEKLTKRNSDRLKSAFEPVGNIVEVSIDTSAHGEDDLSASTALREGIVKVIDRINGQTDIILDISSMPRVVYLSLMAAILRKIIPDYRIENPLYAGGINFQVLVAEDPVLDGKIQSMEPSNDIMFIPGFSIALRAESYQTWPLVWFPILGENRIAQFEKIKDDIITETAEICPILPHPSKNPRRGDCLLLEYRKALFSDEGAETSNILYAHESNPFEAYRQIYKAIDRYKTSLSILGGCSLAVTPLASKLITIGAGLACLEAHVKASGDYIVSMPYSEPTKYIAPVKDVENAKPEISSLLLTGSAYELLDNEEDNVDRV